LKFFTKGLTFFFYLFWYINFLLKFQAS